MAIFPGIIKGMLLSKLIEDFVLEGTAVRVAGKLLQEQRLTASYFELAANRTDHLHCVTI